MHLWFLSNSVPTGDLIAGRRARNDAIARASLQSLLLVTRVVSSGIETVTGATRSLLRAIRQENERRRAIAALRDLDDRMLRDLGIGRSEILGVVQGTLQRRPASLAELRELPRPAPRSATPAAPHDDLPKAA